MKIKKLLAILSSAMMISACMVSPICAEEVSTVPTENQQQEKITDLNEISKLISDHIREKELAAVVVIEDTSNVVAVTVLNYLENEKIINSIIAFINENNIARDYVSLNIFENPDSTVRLEPELVIINIRTAAAIARTLACGKLGILNDYEISIADYNKDGVVNIRDAAAIAYDCATVK